MSETQSSKRRRRRVLLTTGMLAAVALYAGNGLILFIAQSFDWLHPVDQTLLRAAPLVELGRTAVGVRQNGVSFSIDPRRFLELVQGNINADTLTGLVNNGLAELGMGSGEATEHGDASDVFSEETNVVPGEVVMSRNQYGKIYDAAQKACLRLGIKSCPTVVHTPGTGAMRRLQRGGGSAGMFRRGRVLVVPAQVAVIFQKNGFRNDELVALMAGEIAQIALERSWQQDVFRKVSDEATRLQKSAVSDANAAWMRVANTTTELAVQKQIFDSTPWYRRWLAAPTIKTLVDDQQDAVLSAKDNVGSSAVPILYGVGANIVNNAAKRAAIFTGDRAAAVACGTYEATVSSMVKLESLNSSSAISVKQLMNDARVMLELSLAQQTAKFWVGGPLPDLATRAAVLLQWVESLRGAAFKEACRNADTRGR